MGKNNVELLKLAQKYLGKGGSIFNQFCHSSGAWCCAFVTYLFHKGDDAKLFYGGKIVVYCPTAIKWCSANLGMIPAYLALPMDIVFFDWNHNGLPDHIGFIRERKNCDEVYTIEGNTNGGVVAQKTRPVKYIQGIYRPHFPAKFDISKPLEIDGLFGYNSIAMLQKALGGLEIDGIMGKATVKKLQAWAGVAQDGAWGTKTSKAIQKKLGVTADGLFGKQSVMALQRWCNSQCKPTPSTKTNGQKIGEKANELAYASAPAEAKYPSGHAKAAYKTALEKVYPNRSSWGKAPKVGASCDVFVGTCVRASGIDADFPRGLAEQWPYLAKSKKFTCALNLTSRNLKASDLKDGDIITYCYSKGGGHILIYYKGKLKHADVNDWYGRTTTEGGRFKIKGKKWIKVYRAK